MLLALALAMLPSVTACAVLAVPFIGLAGGVIAYAIYGPALADNLKSLEPTPPGGVLDLSDLPRPLLGIISGMLGLALAVVLTALVLATAVLVARYGATVILRLARARPVTRDQELQLWRVVENLCIGAGLQVPTIYVIESGAPNAFATGRNPEHASLVVTRGLLQLLDRRELEGVIAHELSHIGNDDIRLSTALSAVVGTLTLPFRIATMPIRAAFGLHQAFGAVALAAGFCVLTWYGMSAWEGLKDLADEQVAGHIPTFIRWWGIHVMLAPVYAVVVAPLLGLVIRQCVSRQREFLADADAALLTRDPAGLANALIKIGRARGERLAVGEGSVHLYFVDPEGEDTFLHRLLPSHPPLQQRIALLARMAQGVEEAS